MNLVLIVNQFFLSFFCSYLKTLFRDLFERQGYVDDGVFDWDSLKKNGPSKSVASSGRCFSFFFLSFGMIVL